MADFDDLIEAQLEGQTIRSAPLETFAFKSGPMHVWPGFGPLTIGEATYSGVGEAGRIDGVTTGAGVAAEEVTSTLFGSEGLLADLAADAEESAGRMKTVRVQFFGEDWQPLGDTIQIFEGVMGPLKATRTPATDDGAATRIVEVRAVNAFANRNRPAFAFFSDRDQRARSSDDNMFVRVATYSEGTVAWPQF